MKAKQYLYQIIANDKRKQNRIRQLEELKVQAMSTGGFDYSEDRVQTSGAGDRMAQAVTEYVALEEKTRQECIAYDMLKDRIIEQINALDDQRHIELLGLRYVSGMRLKDIAAEMGYNYDSVKHMHGSALQAFARKHKLDTQ